jgi:hypothetical protein
VLELMKRKEGTTLAEIARATDWQNHSIRGFVSGHVTKKPVAMFFRVRNIGGQCIPSFWLANDECVFRA